MQLVVQFYNILDGKHGLGLGLGLGLTLTLTLLGATGCAVLQHSGWETWVRVRVRVTLTLTLLGAIGSAVLQHSGWETCSWQLLFQQ